MKGISSKSIIGSQDIPYIFEDRVNEEDVVNALVQAYENKDLKKMGSDGRQHVVENYSFDKFCKSWDGLLRSVHDRYGSWDTRNHYNRWEFLEVNND